MDAGLRNRLAGMLASLLALTLMACSTSPATPDGTASAADKIRFRLDDINADGLRGAPGGQVSVAYEFCVPADEKTYAAVRQIDAGVQISPGAKGRIGCSGTQALVIGQTTQSGWRDVLMALAALPYVAEIREAFFE